MSFRPLSLTEIGAAHFKALIYGSTGVGKSVFCGASQYLRTFFIDVDIGIDSVRANPTTRWDLVHVAQVRCQADFFKAYDFIEANCSQYDLVVVDTVTELQRLILQELVGASSIKKMYADQRDWGTILLVMEHFARKFRGLPLHVIWTAHENHELDPDTQRYMYVPSFQGQFKMQYGKHFGNIARYQLFDEQKKGENNTTQTITHRFLNCQRDQATEAKDRSSSLEKYEPPNIDTVIGKVVSAITRQPHLQGDL